MHSDDRFCLWGYMVLNLIRVDAEGLFVHVNKDRLCPGHGNSRCSSEKSKRRDDNFVTRTDIRSQQRSMERGRTIIYSNCMGSAAIIRKFFLEFHYTLSGCQHA